MVAESVIDTYKTKFTDMYSTLSQQKMARTRPYCVEIDGVPENYAHERIGETEPRRLEGRLQLATFDGIEYDRRWLEKDRWVVNIPVDEFDIENSRIDPRNQIVNANIMGFNRRVDRTVIAQSVASVKVGKNVTDGVITAVADGVITVPATGGMDLADILSINRNFTDNEVGIPGSTTETIEKGFFCTGEEEEDLLAVAQLTSGDYDRRYQLQNGTLQYAAGIKLELYGGNKTNPIIPVVGGLRQCVAMVKGAMLLGIGSSYKTEVDKRTDYEGVWQVKGKMSFGAVRLEGNRVQLVTTTD